MLPDYVEADEDVFPQLTAPLSVPLTSVSGNMTSAPAAAPSQAAKDYGNSHMFLINFYRRYFDIDLEIFFDKLYKTLIPFTSSDDDIALDLPELYGFIWITGTLVFLMFVSATASNIMGQWLHGGDETPAYNYNFDLIFKLMAIFYGYNVIVPFLLVMWTRFVTKFPEPLPLFNVMLIYGYTNILWVPITLINFLFVVFISYEKHHVLLNVLEWVIVVILGVITMISNLLKVAPSIKNNCVMLHTGDAAAGRRVYFPLLVALGLAHVGFTVLVKWSFFGINV